MKRRKRLPAPGSVGSWVLASRPKTLLAAFAPVLLGTAIAFSQGKGNLWIAMAALLGAVFLQIGANLVNDCADGLRGTDSKDRLGPPRATASGLLPPRSVIAGAAAFFLLAIFFGAILVLVAGWPVAVLGLAAIACGVLYTSGPAPLAYLGLGDLFAFAFFGPVATGGTYFVQTGEISLPAILAGCATGLYAVVLLTINNLRDRLGDQQAGKRTLAVRFGARFARAEIAVCLLLPAALPWVYPDLALNCQIAISIVAVLVSLPVLVPVVGGVSGRALNRLLGSAGTANVLYAAAFSAVLLLTR